MLKLMYITNQPDVASIAEKAGVDRIFVDMEYIGKVARQGGMDTVQCRHTLNDILAIRKTISRAELLVRCNPIHDAVDSEYLSSEEEINGVIECGADIIMLPYFKTIKEVSRFIRCVDGRVRTMILIETPEAAENIDEILEIQGISEVYIGFNDLSLGYKKKFMFELLADGTVEKLCAKVREKKLPYGFGGIASVGKGLLPAEKIIKEHYRLHSTCVILSRSFCNISEITDRKQIEQVFNDGIKDIRNVERECLDCTECLENNRSEVVNIVKQICERG